MTIDHAAIQVAETDLEATIAFYVAALEPLGYKEMMRFPTGKGTAVGLGTGMRADFWVTGIPNKASTVTHIAFAGGRSQIDAFHAAALKAGGTENGEPGPRAQYGPNYYGAFVLDPTGNNIEVVCHDPPTN